VVTAVYLLPVRKGGNVFDIRVGVVIGFLVRDHKRKLDKAAIHYYQTEDGLSKAQKLQWLSQIGFQELEFERIFPDDHGHWINQADDNEWRDLLPLCDKQVKLGRSQEAIFSLYSLGVSSNRDEWVYDRERINLEKKVKFFIKKYNAQIETGTTDPDQLDYSIKWSEALKSQLSKNERCKFRKNLCRQVIYRPFYKKHYYSEKVFSDRLTDNHYQMFGKNLDSDNKVIAIMNHMQLDNLTVLCTNVLPDAGLAGRGIPTVSLHRYTEEGERVDNITDWALKKFQDRYRDQKKKISKEDIFNYVYAVLHDPHYRSKFELNLPRDFPRIPFHEDFWSWSSLGQKLMNLHLNYEQIKPYKLKRIDKDCNADKAKLKADKSTGQIIIDEQTSLTGIPTTVWDYKLGNRSALEWVLDSYKPKKIKDQTIAKQFDCYKFADHKEEAYRINTENMYFIYRYYAVTAQAQ